MVEIDAARALGERIGEPDAIGMWCDQRWQVAYHAGDTDTIVELIATLRDAGDPHWMIYEAVLRRRGRRSRRRHPARTADPGPGTALASLGGAAVGRFNVQDRGGRARHAAQSTSSSTRLETDAAHWAVLGGGVLVEGPVSVWLGRLEAARGDWERARSWSAQAEAAAQRLDAQLWVIEARGRSAHRGARA